MGIKSVELVRKIRDRNYEETKDMTTQEYIAFIQEKSAAFHSKSNPVKQNRQSPSEPAPGCTTRQKAA